MKSRPSLANLTFILSSFSFFALLDPPFYAAQLFFPILMLVIVFFTKKKHVKTIEYPVLVILLTSLYFIILDLIFSKGIYFSPTSLSFLVWAVLVSVFNPSKEETERVIIHIAWIIGALCFFQIFLNQGLEFKLRPIGTLGNPAICSALIGTAFFLETNLRKKILLFLFTLTTLQKGATIICLSLSIPYLIPVFVGLIFIMNPGELHSRFWLLQNSFSTFLENPWMGYGSGNYHAHFFQNLLKSDQLLNLNEYQSHTEIINLLVSLGLIPFLVLIYILRKSIFFLTKQKSIVFLVLLSCVQPIFDSPLICGLFVLLIYQLAVSGSSEKYRIHLYFIKMALVPIMVLGLFFIRESVIFGTELKNRSQQSYFSTFSNAKHIGATAYSIPVAKERSLFLEKMRKVFGDVDLEKIYSKSLESEGRDESAIAIYRQLHLHFPSHIYPKLALYRYNLLPKEELQKVIYECSGESDMQILCMEASLLYCKKLNCNSGN